MSLPKIDQMKRSTNPLQQDFWRRHKEFWMAEALRMQERESCDASAPSPGTEARSAADSLKEP